MLDRNVLPTPASSSPSAILRSVAQPAGLRGGVPSLWEQLRAGATSWLARFLLGLACCLALICLYLWQASTISAIEAETAGMESELGNLERESAALMIQLAQWNAPSFIESKIRELGMKAGPATIYVQVGDAATLDKSKRAADPGEPLWERFTGLSSSLESWMSLRLAAAGADAGVALAGRQ